MTTQHKVIIGAALLTSLAGSSLFSNSAYGHGLMVEPPSRNATCGLPEDQKPHNASLQACVDAFVNDQNGGYQFMSVLTHDVGRQGVTPLPTNVCGFGSETWDSYNNGNTTPWDLPLDWPTTPVAAGPFDITWNISWGPHFDDTEEFVYYITKPGFDYQVGQPLTWDDFEATPFCKETYDDSTPNANPNIVPNTAATTFKTSCTLPARNGRHVVYGEWGRNLFTFERFHGCIDVTFGGGNGPINQPPVATAQSVQVDQNNSVGITLAGTDSDGTIDSYTITTTPLHGTLTGSGSNRLYTPNTDYSGSDSFTFTVRDNSGGLSAPATVDISVTSTGGGPINLAPTADFSYSALGLAASFNGGSSNDPDNGPQALTYSWDFGNGQMATGETPSYTYPSDGNYPVSLTVNDGDLSNSVTKTVTVAATGTGGGTANCEYIISNQWNSGFVAEIRIINTSTTAIDGWQVEWNYTDGSAVTNGWNSTLTGSGPYTAGNLEWNSVIPAGETVTFGFQGTHGGSTAPVSVTGAVCN